MEVFRRRIAVARRWPLGGSRSNALTRTSLARKALGWRANDTAGSGSVMADPPRSDIVVHANHRRTARAAVSCRCRPRRRGRARRWRAPVRARRQARGGYADGSWAGPTAGPDRRCRLRSPYAVRRAAATRQTATESQRVQSRRPRADTWPQARAPIARPSAQRQRRHGGRAGAIAEGGTSPCPAHSRSSRLTRLLRFGGRSASCARHRRRDRVVARAARDVRPPVPSITKRPPATSRQFPPST